MVTEIAAKYLQRAFLSKLLQSFLKSRKKYGKSIYNMQLFTDLCDSNCRSWTQPSEFSSSHWARNSRIWARCCWCNSLSCATKRLSLSACKRRLNVPAKFHQNRQVKILRGRRSPRCGEPAASVFPVRGRAQFAPLCVWSFRPPIFLALAYCWSPMHRKASYNWIACRAI